MTGEKVCDVCGSLVSWYTIGDSAPGCKEREEVYCPKCNNLLGSFMTSETVIVERKNK